MPTYSTVLFFILCQICLISKSKAQEKILFSIGGPTIQTLVVTQSDFDKYGQVRQQSVDSEGRDVTFKGVALHDLLVRAGAPQGKDLRKEKLLYYLIVRAEDGYEALFSLPETDPSFTDQVIMLCMNESDGIPRVNLMVPNDKKKSRWIKNISALELGIVPPKYSK